MEQQNGTPDVDMREQIEALRAERDAALARETALAAALSERTAQLASRETEFSERLLHQAGTPTGPAQEHAASHTRGNLFERVVYALNVAYLEWNPATNQVRFSRALADLFGYDPDTEWTPERVWETVHPDDKPAFRKALTAYFKSAEDRAGFVFRWGTANGEYLWNRYNATVDRDASGRVTRLIGTISNITAEKEAEARNRELLIEQREALEQQTATAEVLGVINASPGNLAPVFEAILEKGLRLVEAAFGTLWVHECDHMHAVASHGLPAALAEFRARNPVLPKLPSSRQMDFTRRAVQAPDVREGEGYLSGHPGSRAVADLGGARTILAVPLIRESEIIGTIQIYRQEVRPFTDGQIALLESFAAQAVIAMENARLLEELRKRTEALSVRNSEYGERIEQQAATIDVLKVMSETPDDTQPVFELITRRARERCNGAAAALFEFDGSRIHLRAESGVDQNALEAYRKALPMEPTRSSITSRAVLDKKLIHIRDMDAEPDLLQIVRNAGGKSHLSVPLMRDNAVKGVLSLSSDERDGFSDSQIALLQTFAEQAVIAIGAVATYRQLQERTAALALRNSEFGERIEQQAATIDVLKVMSASPEDPQPAFQLIAERANVFCAAEFCVVSLLQSDQIHLQAFAGVPNGNSGTYAGLFPRPLDDTTAMGRAMLMQRVVEINDTHSDPQYGVSQFAAWFRSLLSVPLVRSGKSIGAIGIARAQSGNYSSSQVELLQTFAEQAVIAITSAETYRELQDRTAALALRNSEYGERIEQQSATIDVLKVMSNSPSDPKPAFDMIARRAQELCNGAGVRMVEFDGSLVHLRAVYGADPVAKAAYEAAFPLAPTRGSVLCRAILDRQIAHIRNMETEPGLFAIGKNLGMKSVLAVPFLRDEIPIGAISIGSLEYGGFTDSQVALLQTFAEQAVIAITSAETYRELQERTAALAQRNSEFGERIEQQSATIDVLKVMSSTLDDTKPVFEQIARRARELCNGRAASLFQVIDGLVHCAAVDAIDLNPMPPAFAAYMASFPRALARDLIPCRAILDQRIIHIRDAEADLELSPLARGMVRGRYRSQVVIPLMRDGQAIGCISLTAAEPGGFSDSRIALLQTFAEQAVIAIGSVANFRALRERTAELTRSVAELQALEEVLRAVNSSLDLGTVLATIISRAVQLSQADEGTIYEYDEVEGFFVPKAAHGMSAERVAALRERRIRMGETHLGRAGVTRAPVHVSDVQQDTSQPGVAEFLEGIHAVMAVPLLREDKVIGGLVIRRRAVGDFAPTISTLLQTFAGQSVLAIENARLFEQLATREEETRRAREIAEATLTDLRRTQDRLVQTEKMASLGQLTAGIAHEIKNPLNFVNNFSDLSVDLLNELNEAVGPDKIALAADLRAEIDEITETLKGNLQKIAQHGRRADSIVKNMLLHSRTGASERRAADLNAVAEEALNLAYHGARAETPGFNITMEKDLDPSVGMVEIYPQEISRVLVNLINNGFYAAHKRAEANPGFEPILRLSTKSLGDQVEIRVRDNGTGIPPDVRDKIFEPFFTTKPAGQGTGLGLSLSFDIVVKQHGGQLSVASEPGAFTEFAIVLPRSLLAGEK